MWKLTGFIFILIIEFCYSRQLYHNNDAAPIDYLNKNNSHHSIDVKEKNETIKNDFPWMVTVLSSGYGYSLCGGALINLQVILTAAHCVHGKDPNGILVVSGNLNPNGRKPESYLVSKVIVHEDYSNIPPTNDYAILLLTEPMKPDSHAVFRLSTELDEAEYLLDKNTNCFVTGWGLNENWDKRVQVMMVNQPIVSEESCAVYHYGLQKNNICAGEIGTKLGGKGTDGSPLICINDKIRDDPVLMGIYSYSHGTAPGVYMSVAAAEFWIDDIMRNNDVGIMPFHRF